MAAICPCDEIFYGGTRGGGKSDAAIGRQIRGATKWGVAWNGLILRHKYKDLGEIRRRIDELIKYGMPAERTGGANQTNYLKFSNGAAITLSAIQHLEQADDWWGHQFTEISIDEAPAFPFIGLLIDKMKGSLRSPHGVPCHMFMTGNPGGPGAGIIVKTYIEPVPHGKVNKIFYDHPIYGQHVVTRIFVKSRLEDNQILMKADPNYIRKLLSLQDPVLRRAWLEGDWTAFIGQAFQFQEQSHTIEPIWPIPEWAPIFMTFDWGFGAPFSVGWWWVDSDNRLYRFAEWYGSDPNQPGVGMRLADPMIALGILEREQKMGVLGRPITRIAGRDCFQRKPNYLGGGQGPATYDTFKSMENDPAVMSRFGKVNLTLYPGDPDRNHKIRQFRTRIMQPQTAGEMPMMVVYNSCRDFIRTIPALCLDDVKVEDLMDGQEDHIYDEACHVCMARPLAVSDEQITRNLIATMSRERDRKIDEVSRIAMTEFQHTSIKSAVASGTEQNLTPELLQMLENSELDGEY